MFEKLFQYPGVLARHRESPAAEERRRFLLHRANEGAAPATLLRIARELLVFARNVDISAPLTGQDLEAASARGGCDCANCQLHGLGLVLRIGVQWMLASVEDDQHIHFRTQLEVISCFGVVRIKRDSSVGIDVDATEEVDVGYQVARSKTPLR